jgi:FkbM family methyltransferase
MDAHGEIDVLGEAASDDWLAGIAYAITIDAGSACFDAAQRFHIRGEIHNQGTAPLSIGRHGPEAHLIGARLLDADGQIQPGVEARAGIAAASLDPDARAPFMLSLPRFNPAAGDGGLQVSLLRNGQFWLCDSGLDSITIMLGQNDPCPPNVEFPAMSTSSAVDPDPADAPVALSEAASSLRVYEEARLGLGSQATLDDLWNCYRLLLDRRPDAGGFERFSHGVREGMPLRNLVDMFIGSEEFACRFTRQQAEPPTRATINGTALYAPVPQTPAERHVLATGQHKPHLAGAISSLLADGQFILDVGAGIGEFTTLAARKVGPRGRIVSLEPDPQLLRLLLANITALSLKNADILPFAAADGDGFVALVKRGAIMTAKDVGHHDLTGATAVPIVYARTIDSIVPAEQKVDMIRLALDGFDHRAMAGATKLLESWHPPILGEYAPGLLHEFSGIEPQAYLRFLQARGYRRFVAITRDQGAIDLGSDIDKLTEMPARLAAAAIDFCATRD